MYLYRKIRASHSSLRGNKFHYVSSNVSCVRSIFHEAYQTLSRFAPSSNYKLPFIGCSVDISQSCTAPRGSIVLWERINRYPRGNVKNETARPPFDRVKYHRSLYFICAFRAILQVHVHISGLSTRAQKVVYTDVSPATLALAYTPPANYNLIFAREKTQPEIPYSFLYGAINNADTTKSV